MARFYLPAIRLVAAKTSVAEAKLAGFALPDQRRQQLGHVVAHPAGLLTQHSAATTDKGNAESHGTPTR
jgi:hypothetical protein